MYNSLQVAGNCRIYTSRSYWNLSQDFSSKILMFISLFRKKI